MPRWRPVRFALGATLLAVSYAEARRPDLPAYEERVFRAANRLPHGFRAPVRTVMQAGTFATVPAVAALAVLAGRRRLAVTLAAAGTAAWVGAKGIKLLGGRERPSRILDDVVMREGVEGDRGWISGHTAVATTLAGILADELPRPVRPFLWSVPVATAFGRMYVGAHLPHDTLGGAGFGLMLSSLVPRR